MDFWVYENWIAEKKAVTHVAAGSATEALGQEGILVALATGAGTVYSMHSAPPVRGQ
jgi:hypothetical protein